MNDSLQVNIHVNRSLCEFDYGDCAQTAIMSAFQVSAQRFNEARIAVKIKKTKCGYTFGECMRIINLLAKRMSKKVVYHPNSTKISYGEVVHYYNTDILVVLFSEHLSYAFNGEVYDTWVYGGDEMTLAEKPTGWWIIN